MGLGMFATRDIKTLELVLAERPILVTHDNVHKKFADHIKKGAPISAEILEECIQFQLASREAWELQLKAAVDRMTEGDRKAYMDLADTFQGGSGPFVGREQTNAYGDLGRLEGPGTVRTTSKWSAYAAVGIVASRINHRLVFFL